jgi:protein ImuA
MDQVMLTALRREISAIEGRPAGFDENGLRPGEGDGFAGDGNDGQGRVALGVEALDQRLGGGLTIAALHELRCDETRGTGALTGFAAGILSRIGVINDKPILWIEEEMGLAEAGFPFAAGIAAFGIDPGRLIVVRARRPDEALWAFEEGLRCSGLAAALAVIREAPRALDLTASRRLALRSAEHGVTGLLLREAGNAEPGAATTRWRIAPLPAGVTDGFAEGIGRPAFAATLEKSRLGPTGHFALEWDHERQSFAPAAAARPVARPAVPPHRPDHTAEAGEVVAFRKAG